MKVIHFLGYRGGGKTRAISLLARKLSKAGKKVGALKHIHDENFSIDKRGKDTWVYGKSGAGTVVAISPSEFAVIRRRSIEGTNAERDLQEAFRIFEKDGVDFLLIEGFNNILSRAPNVKSIICSSDANEARSLLKLHKNAICVIATASGNLRPGSAIFGDIPILILPRESQRLVQLIS